MKSEDLVYKLESISTSIEENVLSVTPAIRVKFKSTPLRNGYLKRFVDEIGIRSQTIGDGVKVIEDYVKTVKEECKELSSYIEKNKYKIEKHDVKLSLINDTVQNLSGIVMYSSDILTSIFITDSLTPARAESMNSGLRPYIKLYTVLDNTKLVDDLRKVPIGNKSMVKSFLGDLSFVTISGFNGNPFFIIGRFVKQWEARKIHLLEERKNLIKMELLDLTTGEQNPKIKRAIEIHKQEIFELETEIELLQD